MELLLSLYGRTSCLCSGLLVLKLLMLLIVELQSYQLTQASAHTTTLPTHSSSLGVLLGWAGFGLADALFSELCNRMLFSFHPRLQHQLILLTPSHM